MRNYHAHCNFSTLKGLTLIKIEEVEGGEDEARTVILFYTACGRVFKMYHEEDCCESVELEDVCGDFSDLLNSPILVAEGVTEAHKKDPLEIEDSYTYTFYKLDTCKGGVTMRWCGTSNGDYSERVDFAELKEKDYETRH